jgi:hypothetical protein
MELKEIENMLTKLDKVGIATCEICNAQVKFSEIDLFNGSYVCPECLRKLAWKAEGVLELPS